jgi:pyruvate formate lyase activating enzyme
MSEGLRFVYTGNVHDAEGGSTLCPGCGSVAVIRDWYAMRHYGLTDDGRCQGCGWRIAGVYDGPAGQWGRRRLPIAELSSVK